MKVPLFAMLCTMALISISLPSAAQENTDTIRNTVKQCLDDWRANRGEAKGLNKREYVAQCRDGFVPARAVTLAAARATTHRTRKVVTRRSLTSERWLHLAAPAITAESPKAVKGTPTGLGDYEGTVDW